MNSDIRLSVGFWQHPKTRKLVKRLGLEGVRSLQILWLWAAQNKPDGQLTGMDWEDIELAADWEGDEHAFFDHCLGVWIDEGEDCYLLHDWEEHNPWQAEAAARSEQARQNARSGWEKRRAKQQHANGNTDNMRLQCGGIATAMQDQSDCNADAKQQHANGNAPFLSSPNQELNTPPYPPASGGSAPGEEFQMQEPGEPGACEIESSDRQNNADEISPAGKKKRKPKLTAYSPDFEAFWKAYPRKSGKDAAWKAWQKRRHEIPALPELAAILARQSHCEQWQRDGGQFIPHPATWLNQGRWQDEVEATQGWTPKPANW